MSDATFSGPVVVTGASGYVASWVVHELLSRGATVHGTVRDPNHPTKTAHLRALDDELPGTLKLFAADLLKPGSFAEALDGATTVIHTASPFHSGDGDPQATLVQPALDGTANVLDQASQTPTVTRVVLTSSVLAVYGDATESDGRPLTEDDWNSSSSVDHQPYAYSKTVAERKAWELAEAQSQWRLVVVNPAFVMGPSLSGRKDSTSMDFLLNNLKGTWNFMRAAARPPRPGGRGGGCGPGMVGRAVGRRGSSPGRPRRAPARRGAHPARLPGHRRGR